MKMNKTPEQRKKELAILKANNQLLEECKTEALLRGHANEANMIEMAKKEVLDEVNMLGATPEEMEKIPFNEPNAYEVEKYKKHYEKKGIDPNIVSSRNGITTIETVENVSDETFVLESNEETNDNVITSYGYITDDNAIKHQTEIIDAVSEFDDDVQYDIIPLPSNGEPYPHKKSRIPVSFLTAADENVITSPNLYRDGNIIDVILKRKIMDKTIDVNSLCRGDRDAIILWIRATGYEPMFPITVHDPELDTEYDVTIDLTTIKTKPFNLKADENGYFDYTTKNGKLIKFKFLNRYDEIKLTEMGREDNLNIKRFRLNRIVDELKTELTNDKVLTSGDRSKILGAISTVDSWSKNIKTKNKSDYEKNITNSMSLMIVSVDGNTDRQFINKFINTMPAFESFKFRKYVRENEPGMDFEITIDRPENLGGGSFKTFLSIDPSIFINIA